MKLWYTQWELHKAQEEAQTIIQEIMRDIGQYIKGDVSVRMAWRFAARPLNAVPLAEWKIYREQSILTYIPEAELLLNGEVVRCELLDLLYINILHFEMKLLQEGRKAISEGSENTDGI